MLFDTYRDAQTREAMIDYVADTRSIEPQRALDDLRALDHIGLAWLYRDMLRATGQGHLVDYDPSEWRGGPGRPR